MRRDRWFALSMIGGARACLACLTPIAILALGAIGLGAWTGHFDLVLFSVLVGFVVLALSRYWITRRGTL
jgi:mercuric ion transport protein